MQGLHEKLAREIGGFVFGNEPTGTGISGDRGEDACVVERVMFELEKTFGWVNGCSCRGRSFDKLRMTAPGIGEGDRENASLLRGSDLADEKDPLPPVSTKRSQFKNAEVHPENACFEYVVHITEK